MDVKRKVAYAADAISAAAFSISQYEIMQQQAPTFPQLNVAVLENPLMIAIQGYEAWRNSSENFDERKTSFHHYNFLGHKVPFLSWHAIKKYGVPVLLGLSLYATLSTANAPNYQFSFASDVMWDVALASQFIKDRSFYGFDYKDDFHKMIRHAKKKLVLKK